MLNESELHSGAMVAAGYCCCRVDINQVSCLVLGRLALNCCTLALKSMMNLAICSLSIFSPQKSRTVMKRKVASSSFFFIKLTSFLACMQKGRKQGAEWSVGCSSLSKMHWLTNSHFLSKQLQSSLSMLRETMLCVLSCSVKYSNMSARFLPTSFSTQSNREVYLSCPISRYDLSMFSILKALALPRGVPALRKLPIFRKYSRKQWKKASPCSSSQNFTKTASLLKKLAAVFSYSNLKRMDSIFSGRESSLQAKWMKRSARVQFSSASSLASANSTLSFAVGITFCSPVSTSSLMKFESYTRKAQPIIQNFFQVIFIFLRMISIFLARSGLSKVLVYECAALAGPTSRSFRPKHFTISSSFSFIGLQFSLYQTVSFILADSRMVHPMFFIQTLFYSLLYLLEFKGGGKGSRGGGRGARRSGGKPMPGGGGGSRPMARGGGGGGRRGSAVSEVGKGGGGGGGGSIKSKFLVPCSCLSKLLLSMFLASLKICWLMWSSTLALLFCGTSIVGISLSIFSGRLQFTILWVIRWFSRSSLAGCSGSLDSLKGALYSLLPGVGWSVVGTCSLQLVDLGGRKFSLVVSRTNLSLLLIFSLLLRLISAAMVYSQLLMRCSIHWLTLISSSFYLYSSMAIISLDLELWWLCSASLSILMISLSSISSFSQSPTFTCRLKLTLPTRQRLKSSLNLLANLFSSFRLLLSVFSLTFCNFIISFSLNGQMLSLPSSSLISSQRQQRKSYLVLQSRWVIFLLMRSKAAGNSQRIISVMRNRSSPKLLTDSNRNLTNSAISSTASKLPLLPIHASPISSTELLFSPPVRCPLFLGVKLISQQMHEDAQVLAWLWLRSSLCRQALPFKCRASCLAIDAMRMSACSWS